MVETYTPSLMQLTDGAVQKILSLKDNESDVLSFISLSGELFAIIYGSMYVSSKTNTASFILPFFNITIILLDPRQKITAILITT